MSTSDPLASWNECEAKWAIVDFVRRVSTDGPGFVAERDRIATFDNDGTLWVEKPMPPQFDFLSARWHEDAARDPSLAAVDPYRSLISRDPTFFAGISNQDPSVVDSIEKAVARSWSGTAPEVFDSEVRDWLDSARHPRFHLPYTALIYRPMLELFAYLSAHGFRVFVCSGGGRDFIRVFAEGTWGIPKDQVLGTSANYDYVDGQIRRTDSMLGGLALGPGKPAHIYAHAGRLPLLAVGNSDGDIEMLESAQFAILVDHDDLDREYAYSEGAERAMEMARARKWTIVSMREDWDAPF